MSCDIKPLEKEVATHTARAITWQVSHTIVPLTCRDFLLHVEEALPPQTFAPSDLWVFLRVFFNVALLIGITAAVGVFFWLVSIGG